MQIGLVGTGQMGTAVEAVAVERGHEVVVRYNSANPLLEADADQLASAEVLIDFSLPDLAASHLERYAELDATAVVGTTGWYDRLPVVEEQMRTSEGAILYAPNFSLGVAVLREAVRAVGPLIDALDGFDVAVHEAHHTNKADSPSGTALMLGEQLLDLVGRKTHIEPEAQHGLIDPEALHVSSTRLGGVFGEHTVTIDSPFDSIRLSHEAKNRRGFAFGAVRAAEWLAGRTGLYSLDDLIAAWLPSR